LNRRPTFDQPLLRIQSPFLKGTQLLDYGMNYTNEQHKIRSPKTMNNQADIFAPIPVEPIPRIALSVAETAKSLSICERTVSSMIAKGELPVVNVGTRRLIPIDGLREWAKNRTEGAVNQWHARGDSDGPFYWTQR
jgi:excisionase family DNA binding protein